MCQPGDREEVLQHDKDLLVELSGIINLCAAKYFDALLIKDVEVSASKAQPDGRIEITFRSLNEILDKNGIEYLRDEITILDAERVAMVRQGIHIYGSMLKVVLDIVRSL